MYPQIPRSASECLIIPVNGNTSTLNGRIVLDADDPEYVILEVQSTTNHSLNPFVVLSMPTIAKLGKKFTFRMVTAPHLATAPSSNTMFALIHTFLQRGVEQTSWSLGFGQEITFVFTQRGWQTPPGITGGTDPGTSRAIAIGSGATTRAGVAIGENAKTLMSGSNDTNVAIGHSASAGGANSTAIGNSATADAMNGVAIGASAVAGGTSAAAIGASASALGAGVAVGASAVSGANAVAIGASANAGTYGTAIGANSDSNTFGSVALGYYSKAQRVSEVVHALDGASTTLLSYSLLAWCGSVDNDTPTELFLAGVSNQRAVLLNSSAFVFDIMVVARNGTTPIAAGWRLQGAIRRGANAAATALIGTVSKTLLGNDAWGTAWDVNVTADTTNGSLKVTVTGEAGQTVGFHARGDIAEVRF